jgi:hypothetical protein
VPGLRASGICHALGGKGGGVAMDCVICKNLERDFERRRAEYIAALSAAYYRVSSVVAASKNVDMQRAKSALNEHQFACAAVTTRSATHPVKEMERL